MPYLDLERRAALALAAIVALGCGRVHLGDHDGGTAGDGGPGPLPCGPVLCDPGFVCCDASCGLCGPAGGGCPAIACVGCRSDSDCNAGERCDLPWGSCSGEGVCVSRAGDTCPPEVRPVCGCDGATYPSPCEAGASGVGVQHEGDCPTTSCAPQRAIVDGPCTVPIGMRWNGARCESLSGCTCEGPDCDALFTNDVECERTYAGCAACTPHDAAGEGPCEELFGFAWNGAECVPVGGCSCTGSDCAALYPTAESCRVARAHCGGGGGPCLSGADCGADRYCHFEPGECAGSGDGLGDCRPIPPELACPSGDPEVCGCDGRTYLCADAAHQSGVSVLHGGPCADGPCAPMDATGVGPCAAVLGVRWDGSRCETISGCSCSGASCDRLYRSEAECLAAHGGCDRPRGQPCRGPSVHPCRPDEWCDYPDPHLCEATSGDGQCRPRPGACDLVFAPVCGCDGVVYENDCAANGAGVDSRDVSVCEMRPPP